VNGASLNVDAAQMLRRISPAIGNPSGKTTLVGKGRIRDVIGQTKTKPVSGAPSFISRTCRALRRRAAFFAGRGLKNF